MIPGIETLACQDLAVPAEVMHHIVRVESSYNPYAIGVVGTRLTRQPRSLAEAVATARQLERDGFNFSLGLAQVNLHNLAKQGLGSYELAFDACPNLAAGSRILADCHARAHGDWDKAFSCYYSGNFSTGFRDGYVRKIRASIAAGDGGQEAIAIAVSEAPTRRREATARQGANGAGGGLVERRSAPARPAGGTVTREMQAASIPPAAPLSDVTTSAFPQAPFVPAVGAAAGSARHDRSADGVAAIENRDTAFVF